MNVFSVVRGKFVSGIVLILLLVVYLFLWVLSISMLVNVVVVFVMCMIFEFVKLEKFLLLSVYMLKIVLLFYV